MNTNSERAKADDASSEPESSVAAASKDARYRALFEAIDDGFCIIEFVDGSHGPLSDYIHVEANSGYERHTGIADIVGKSVYEIAPTGAQAWVDLYGKVLATGQPGVMAYWTQAIQADVRRPAAPTWQ